MSLTPAEIVSLIGSTTPNLDARIGSIQKVWTAPNHNIEGRFLYVRYKDGKPSVDYLLGVAYARIVNFCIPRARIQEVKKEMQENPDRVDCWVTLVSEARDLFIKTYEKSARSGELGELLLYMLIESVLHAPIVACKMYLKTSLQMPVHGGDGVHMGFEGEKLIMYWGESKLHQTKSSAFTDIAKSISGFANNRSQYENEVRLIKSNLNMDELNLSAKEALKSYFHPYKPQSNNLIDCYACLAGFDSDIYDKASNIDNCENKFCESYEKTIQSIGSVIIDKAIEYNIDKLRFSYFILPFPSVEVARQKFQSKLWGRP